MRRLVLLVCLVACKNHAQEAEERRELAAEVLAEARAFGKAMCACKDDTCARATHERWDRWAEQTRTTLDGLEQKQGEEVTASKEAIEAAFKAFEECAIRFAIGR